MRISLNLEQATDARDGLARDVYGRLFDWIVGSVNESIESRAEAAKDAAQQPDRSFSGRVLDIGVLDIFGFECFKRNSFEQLCI
eukprot:CAMPEP_0197570182 /NCGR_PEP_ID=MMETSP1320-20131121/40266_1 /TAXON_ID=91990 /ORGANISM="Bolidomonas sp., Strain RCC2347" /LENGTH=83 /DNA_ID=CAMNT_0043132603 /DNA_START=61 /DNA_END=309 /DNA_ORIENTATION=-